MKEHRRSIGLKITFIVTLAVLVFLLVCVSLSYFCLFGSLRNALMDGRKNAAQLMAGSIAVLLDRQADLVRINASDDALKEAVKESNAKYQGMDAPAVKRYLLDMDNKWLNPAPGNPLMEEYLGNKASLVLKSGLKQKSEFSNILLTDKYGALVGASYQASNFYYAGEDWWKQLLAESRDGLWFGDAVFDEVKGGWFFPLAAAIKDDKAKLIGAYRALIDISLLSKPLAEFGAGKNVTPALIDSRGYLIFYPGAKPFSNKFCEYNELQKLLKDDRGWSVIDTVYMENALTAVAFSPVVHSLLSGKNTILYTVVAENSAGIFSPLNGLAVKMIVFSALIAFAVLILAGRVFRGVFAVPIGKLSDGMRYIGAGRLDYRVELKTGDEIEELIVVFNEMAENLSHITTSVKMLEQEKAGRNITEQRLQREDSGFLSLLLQVHGSLSDLNKDIERARQEALGARNERQIKELGLLESRAGALIKKLERDIYASELEVERVEFKTELKDLRDIIKESVFVFESRVREKGLDMRLDISQSALRIRADKDKIKQVFDILMENSLKATEKGYIAISVTQVKDGIECSVSDTGAAIPKESLGEIFERFSGFERIRKPQETVWLDPSLYIARRIIEKHNGKIWAENMPGEITRFVFSLPIVPAK